MDHSCALDSKFLLTSLFLILLSLCHTLLYPDIVVLAVSAPAMATNTSRDQETLLYFKSQLSDPLRALSSWSSESPDLCKWRGITCGRRHPFRVTALDLDSLSLSGPLPSCIANLTFLERIHLPNNRLHGNIPRDIGRLFRLQYLNLSMNSLDGEIPETLSFCSRLRVIILGDNGLNGEIPYNLSKCLKLQTLRLNNNMLEGEIPPGFGSHPNLQTLVLTSNNLAGNIPLLLGSSSSLSLVRLENNKLGGKIPSFLGNSSSLSALLLSNNSLTGQIPQTLFNSSTLIKIDLSNNRLTGPIPPPFSKISCPLSYLDLTANILSGGIPPSLGNLSSLIFLYLAGNNLEGSIPESLGRFPRLQQLDLSQNDLTGSIPSSIYNISSLTDLGLWGNKLSGAIPLDIGHTLPNLQSLNMNKNQLQGQIPSSLSDISGLQHVDLSSNSLDGVVPPNLGSLQNLLYLDLGWNLLRAGDWSFLSSLTNCRLLEKLGLQENDLEGALPNSIGNLSPQLETLLIGGNRLNGSIPDEIGNLVSLTALYLDNNQFTGIIPATLGNLQNLVFLQLSCNDLSGPIPPIGNLKQLNHLYMQDNKLNGSIPISLGSCKNLLNLNLSYNRLDGIIPKELFSISSLSIALDLSHNHLYGPIPLEVGSLINLGRLDMSENRLSGELPSALGGCQHLEYLQMEGNFLQGNIPQSFQNLKGIKELDLSRNNLSGPIPEFLESFGPPCYLNLSFNDLEGEVPKGGIFSNISEISVLGNSKLCGGDSKLRLPPCSARPTSSRLLSSRMLKVVILVASVTAISLLCLFIFLRRSRKAGKANQSVHYLEDKYKKVTYTDIFRATDGFSPDNLVGSGSFGSVYKGKLDAGQYNIAVKAFNLHQHGAEKSFTDECEALRNIRHRNLINVITSCSTMDPLGNEFKALIFEYMPNGNLENWLHPTVCRNNQTSKLNLIQRLNIAVDVASALSYLHHHCASPIVHCDLKPSNVLLDNEMIARVTDFGLARFLPAAESTTSRNSTSLIGLKGSIGYIAPEYGMGAKISKEGDVYSYGVLLLEMLTGKRPTNEMFKDGLSLHKFVSMAFTERVEDILDHELFKDEREHGLNSGMENHANTFVFERCIIPLVEIGLSCSVESPKDRPTMEDVAREILAVKEAFSAAQV